MAIFDVTSDTLCLGSLLIQLFLYDQTTAVPWQPMPHAPARLICFAEDMTQSGGAKHGQHNQERVKGKQVLQSAWCVPLYANPAIHNCHTLEISRLRCSCFEPAGVPGVHPSKFLEKGTQKGVQDDSLVSSCGQLMLKA